jgi:hypothetical protein
MANPERNMNRVGMVIPVSYMTMTPEETIDFAFENACFGIRQDFEYSARQDQFHYDHVVEVRYQHRNGTATINVSALEPRLDALKRLKKAILGMHVV